ncbi:MAG: hypothetical protein KC621_15015 [Myxococcales bacterium]|nr:hypothetical protein [Myxococcales bacterium]
MKPCSTCGSHVRPSTACPSCGSPMRIARTSMAAVMLGLAVAGCGGDAEKSTTDGNTGDTGETTPTSGVDYGTMMMVPVEEVHVDPLDELSPDLLSE